MRSLNVLRFVLALLMLAGVVGMSQPALAAPSQQATIVTITYTSSANRVIADADGGPPPIPRIPVTTQDILHVADMGRIIDVDVVVDITHDNVYDLAITLEHNGTTADLFTHVGDNCDNLNLTFNDGSPALPVNCATVNFAGPYPTGTFAPAGNLAGFNDQELAGPWTLSITDIYPENPGDNGGLLNSWSIIVTFEVTAIVSPDSQFFLTDRRVNRYDVWASAAIYCNAYGIDVYAIDAEGYGALAFRATPEDIAARGIPEEGATPAEMLIKEGDGHRLFRLPDGLFQLNAPANGDPNGYVFIWEGCAF